jgi:hypothetical protein
MQTVFCGNCGKPMTADKQFCTTCGHSLSTIPASAPPAAFHPYVHPQASQSFVNDLRDLGAKEFAGLSFGAFAGASTGYFGGKEAVHTAFGFLRFWIFLFVVWLLFLFAVVPALMDGHFLPLVVWAIAGTPRLVNRGLRFQPRLAAHCTGLLLSLLHSIDSFHCRLLQVEVRPSIQ